MNETPTPPPGFRIIPRAYLEAGNPLPEDALVRHRQSGSQWWGSSHRGLSILKGSALDVYDYATAQPLPCFQSPDQGPEHWADLCENDVIQDGDEWEIDGLWHPAEAIGCRVGDIGHRYRRRVAPEPTAEQLFGGLKGPGHGKHIAPFKYPIPPELAEKIDETPTVHLITGPNGECLCGTDLKTCAEIVERLLQPEPTAGIAEPFGKIDMALRIAELEREKTQMLDVIRAYRDESDRLNRERDALAKELAEARTLMKVAAESCEVLEKANESLRAQLAASEKDRQWQPIETAPKDGTKFLIWEVDFKAYRIAWWREHRGAFGDDGYRYNFAHWLPLRAAPTQSEAL